MERAARMQGMNFYSSAPATLSHLHPKHGVGVLSRWPVQELPNPSVLDQRRFVVLEHTCLRLMRGSGASANWLSGRGQQRRCVEYVGSVCAEPITPLMSLAQGDPRSPARLAVLLSAWEAFMRADAPNIKAGCYVDDRLLWTSMPQHADMEDSIRSALDVIARFEKLL
eukprot:3434212-Amphidinium_carterae.1